MQVLCLREGIGEGRLSTLRDVPRSSYFTEKYSLSGRRGGRRAQPRGADFLKRGADPYIRLRTLCRESKHGPARLPVVFGRDMALPPTRPEPSGVQESGSDYRPVRDVSPVVLTEDP